MHMSNSEVPVLTGFLLGLHDDSTDLKVNQGNLSGRTGACFSYFLPCEIMTMLCQDHTVY